ncbi:MAG: zf-HC2 domain-containing protein [Acidimicrobiales bacterium]
MRPVDCDELMAEITDYLDGALAPERVAAIEAHLPDCSGCRAALHQFRQTIALAGRLRSEDVGGLDDRTRDELVHLFRSAN